MGLIASTVEPAPALRGGPGSLVLFGLRYVGLLC